MKSLAFERIVATLLLTALLVGLAGSGTRGDSAKSVSSPQAGKQNPAANQPPPPPPPPSPTDSGGSASAAPAVMVPMLAAWQRGDHALALRRFTEADWKARPLFASGSSLSLSETQFAALPTSDHDAKGNDMLKEVGVLLQLVKAVARAGEEAAEKKDSAQARRYFTSLKRCADALDEGDTLVVVKEAAPMMKRRADEGLAKLGP